MVRSELLVSFIATTVRVAGNAIKMMMMKGITVHTISTVVFSCQLAATAPLDLRCFQIE